MLTPNERSGLDVNIRHYVEYLEKLVGNIDDVKPNQHISDYHDFYHNSPIGHHKFDKNKKIIDINEAELNMFEYEKDEVLGKMTWGDIIHPSESSKFGLHWQDINEGKTVTVEYRIVTKTGKEKFVHLEANPKLDANGKLLSTRGIVIDITQSKKDEEEKSKLQDRLIHTQKLESLGVLAGGIAHDFNNLLVGILGNVSLALSQIKKESPIMKLLQEIEDISIKASDISNQMLAYSGKGRFAVESSNLSQIVESMEYFLNISISKSVILKYHLTEYLPLVNVDVTQIRQIIMNLVINASEAIGKRSGVISITTGLMHADEHYLSSTYVEEELEVGNYVYLEVSDTGNGMDKETIGKIFDPFHTTKFSGRGLGLSIVMGIVRGHSGAIKVYSEIGNGTTFKFLLPCSDEMIEVKSQIHNAKDELDTSSTILVCDDEETVRLTIKRILESFGFTVIVASDGREGVSILRENVGIIKVVLMDMTMPHLNGVDTFREMKQINSDLDIILMSGYNEMDAINQFAGKGLAGFIQKPFTLNDLKSKISEFLAK